MKPLINQNVRRTAELSCVTDHALVRYLERLQGYDFNAVRSEILSGPVRMAIAQKLSMIIVSGVEYRFAYRDGEAFLTTILVPDKMELEAKTRNERRVETHKYQRRQK